MMVMMVMMTMMMMMVMMMIIITIVDEDYVNKMAVTTIVLNSENDCEPKSIPTYSPPENYTPKCFFLQLISRRRPEIFRFSTGSLQSKRQMRLPLEEFENLNFSFAQNP